MPFHRTRLLDARRLWRRASGRLAWLLLPRDIWPLRRRTGPWGEGLAARFLRSRGLRVLARNLHLGPDEIDIVALDGATLVFVEVKTVASTSRVGGFERVGVGKRRRLRRAVDRFLARSRGELEGWRFDVVVVEFEWRRRRRRRLLRVVWYPAQPLADGPR